MIGVPLNQVVFPPPKFFAKLLQLLFYPLLFHVHFKVHFNGIIFSLFVAIQVINLSYDYGQPQPYLNLIITINQYKFHSFKSLVCILYVLVNVKKTLCMRNVERPLYKSDQQKTNKLEIWWLLDFDLSGVNVVAVQFSMILDISISTDLYGENRILNVPKSLFRKCVYIRRLFTLG